MGKYALQDMISIRTMREDRAGKELVVARRVRDQAIRDVDAAKDSLSDFRKTKDERRDALYAAVIGQLVKREQLENVREAVNRIDEQDVLLQEAVHQAQAKLSEKETAAEKARVHFVEQSKNLIKIKSHKEAWMEEDRKEQERIADAEMEEFTGKRNTNDDFDDFN